MYEASFGLKRRPFAATPDATCFLAAGPVQAAFDELVVCVEQGQGIAVLTAPAGTGKTLLCERLRCELGERFETVFLRHASFLTRRALLQTILCELNHSYHQPSEQELRLELFPAIRALQPKREALVLICDEAHQLTDSLIEELRILADFAESGRPLVRLVLVGQLSLEEKLAQPSLEAFNQRIRAHVNLPLFDRAGSQDYIDYRLTWSGGRTDEIFTPAALDLIAQVSDGVPRCINQLADHTLLLAFVSEQSLVDEDLVREALNDLRQLPLHWNELSSSGDRTHRNSDDTYSLETRSESSVIRDSSGLLHQSIPNGAYSYEPSADDTLSKTESFEIGSSSLESDSGSTSDYETSNTGDQISVEIGSDDWRHTVELFSRQDGEVRHTAESVPSMSQPFIEATAETGGQHSAFVGQFQGVVLDSFMAATRIQEAKNDRDSETSESCSATSSGNWSSHTSMISSEPISKGQEASCFHEEVIIDRYVSIDAGFTPISVPQADTSKAAQVHAEIPSFQSQNNSAGIDRVDAHDHSIEDFNDLDADFDIVRTHRDEENATTIDPLDKVLDAVHSLIDVVADARAMNPSKFSVDTAGDGTGAVYRIETPANVMAWDAVETELAPAKSKPRPFRYLFSTLRRKQQELQ